MRGNIFGSLASRISTEVQKERKSSHDATTVLSMPGVQQLLAFFEPFVIVEVLLLSTTLALMSKLVDVKNVALGDLLVVCSVAESTLLCFAKSYFCMFICRVSSCAIDLVQQSRQRRADRTLVIVSDKASFARGVALSLESRQCRSDRHYNDWGFDYDSSDIVHRSCVARTCGTCAGRTTSNNAVDAVVYGSFDAQTCKRK